MQVPLKWLQEYVDIEGPREELYERITLAGLEVVGIEEIGARWDQDKILVGEVKEIRPHPNADRLTVAVVDYGADEPLAVVTGAPNLRPGDSGVKVAFATEGAMLIDGYATERKYVKLRPSKIRGVASKGMVCSEKELGISDEHEGIMILPADAPVGVPLRDYLGDSVLELDLTNDMAYCTNMAGVGREVAALLGVDYHEPPTQVLAEGEKIAGQVLVEIADPQLCKRYSAALIKGVSIGESPFWMQQRLVRSSVRPINVIVDITNYVMLELGQPLHAFDYHKLRPKPEGGPAAIIVRRALPGEKISTLDGVERDLTEEMLLITDGGGPVAIAGVMGGMESEVTDDTRDILLEAANFDNISIRKTSQTLKLSSEAAVRFGKGIDPELTTVALRRACELMRTLAGGEVAQGFADVYPGFAPLRTIQFKPTEVERLAGISLSTEEIIDLLERLGFECAQATEQDGPLSVTIPSHRLDVSVPADLVEEVARMYGYDRIPVTLMEDELPPQRVNWELEIEERVRDVLAGCGLSEIINYPLTNLESIAKLSPGAEPPDANAYIRIANPLTNDREYMRQTMMNMMLETVWANLRFADRVALFEIGRVYLPVSGENLPEEPRRLCISMTGPRAESSWLGGDADLAGFFDLKGVVETLLERLNVENVSFEPTQHPTFHPGRVARLLAGDVELGLLGELHPTVRDAFDLPANPVCLLELDMEALTEAAHKVEFMKPISRYPAVRQDLAIIVDEGTPGAKVEEAIRSAGGKLLVDVLLFDVYKGEQVPEGKKSLAYSLTYQSLEGTLTDKQVAKLQGRILKKLKRQIGADLRA